MGRIKAEKVSLATRAERLAKIKVEEINGVLCTTSLNVAEVFGKEHSNIIRLIDNVIKKWVEIGLITNPIDLNEVSFIHPDSTLKFKHNDSQIVPQGLKGFDYSTYFIESTYIDEQGKPRRMYLLTEKGVFVMLLKGNIELALHMLKTVDVSNIFEALDGFVPTKPVIPYYLYLLQSGNSNVYKIGIAKDIDVRVKNISHHGVLKLVESWKFDSKEECRAVEIAVHKALHDCKANKEWFYLSEDSDKSVEIVDRVINSIGT